MQGIATFDLVILLITILLGLKGLFRGLIKEVFGIVGIIGGIFVASRVSTQVGDLINNILSISNPTTIKLLGFIVALVIIWLIVYGLGIVISKIFSLSGLGFADRIFGFIFGMGKVFLIFSVLAYALSQIGAFKKTMDEKFSNTITLPYLINIGSYIVKLDTNSIVEKLDNAASSITNTPNSVQKGIEESEEELKRIQKSLEENAKDMLIEQGIDTLKDLDESDLHNEDNIKTNEN